MQVRLPVGRRKGCRKTLGLRVCQAAPARFVVKGVGDTPPGERSCRSGFPWLRNTRRRTPESAPKAA